MRKTVRRRRRRSRLIPSLLLFSASAILITLIILIVHYEGRKNPSVSSQPESQTSSEASPTPTLAAETDFWGNKIDLSATQNPQNTADRYKKWPAEPGFESVRASLDPFKAAAGSEKPLAGAVVFLDPGHGGEDLGAVYPRAPIAPEIIERNINLKVAFLMKDILEKAGAKVVLTREDNEIFYRLYYRSAIVGKYILGDFLSRLDADSLNRPIVEGYIGEMEKTIEVNNNDDPTGIFYPLGVNQSIKNLLDIEDAYTNCIYLSLHCNASEEPDTISGTRVYYVSNASVYRKQSKETKDIICPEYQNYDDESRLRLSTLIYEKITAALPQMVFSQDSGAVEETDYAVIREMNLVGALIEMGFVNDTGDRAVLMDDANLDRYADSICQAIYEYFCR